MALDLDCNTTVYYTGNDVQTDFLYQFPIIETEDLRVALYNETTTEYDEVLRPAWDDVTSPAGTVVRFAIAPASGQKLVIYRLTDIDPMKATFHPGHPVRAEDLNDNFEQLQYAIEDNRCIIEGDIAAQGDKYWRKVDETVYRPDDWIISNEYVASTAAIEDRIDAKQLDIIDDINDIQQDIEDIKGDINGINVELGDINTEIDIIKEDITEINGNIGDINTNLETKLDKDKGYTQQDVLDEEYTVSDEHFAYTSALSELYDTIFLEQDQSAPDVSYTHPGKWMVDSYNQLFMWNGQQWFMPIAGGGGGGGGGAHTTIRTTNPINQSYNSASNEYSLTFNINSLNSVPNSLRTRR